MTGGFAYERRMTRSKVGVLIGFAIASALVAACAPSLSKRQAMCQLTARDSAYLGEGPVYRDCAVGRRAKLILSSAQIDYRPTRPGCSSVELEMVVDALGIPERETVHVLRTNNDEMAVAVVASVRNWRFEPATIDTTPVRQIVNTSRTVSTFSVVVPAGQSPEGAASRAVPRVPKC